MKRRGLFFIVAFVVALLGLIIALQTWVATRSSSVLIEWVTTSQIDTAGFNLYRQASRDRLEKVNEGIIPTAGNPISGNKYRYIDRNLEPSATYHYLLEEIDSDGNHLVLDSLDISLIKPAFPLLLYFLLFAVIV